MRGIVNDPTPHSGTVTEVNDTGITLQLAGRMGVIKVPWRMVISEKSVKVGDKVSFMMSLLEIEN
ncbi:MAG: CBO2463/CBO2479 domain-containing protein [Clostridiaceae bacterium]